MLVLERFCYEPTFGTFGVLKLDGYTLCFTLEKPWLDNIREKSCIPCGVYHLDKWTSVIYGNTVVMWNEDLGVVPTLADCQSDQDRYAILVHAGNTEHDTLGCILVGQELGCLWVDNNPYWAVTRSRDALKEVMPVVREHDKIVVTNTDCLSNAMGFSEDDIVVY